MRPPKEPTFACYCSQCGSGIQPGELYYELWTLETVCKRCVDACSRFAEEPEDPLGWCAEEDEDG